MDFISTVKNSLLEGFFPKGWDMEKLDKCCEKGVERESFWHKEFNPIECEDIHEFDILMGHEIALQIKKSKDKGEKLAMIARRPHGHVQVGGVFPKGMERKMRPCLYL